jgi:hypothetical protein
MAVLLAWFGCFYSSAENNRSAADGVNPKPTIEVER